MKSGLARLERTSEANGKPRKVRIPSRRSRRHALLIRRVLQKALEVATASLGNQAVVVTAQSIASWVAAKVLRRARVFQHYRKVATFIKLSHRIQQLCNHLQKW